MYNLNIQMYAISLAALWSQLHTYIIRSQFQVQLWREHAYLGTYDQAWNCICAVNHNVNYSIV